MKFCTACFDGNYPSELDCIATDNQKYLFEDMACYDYY